MTASARQAFTLANAGRWSEALVALRRVADGSTRDPLGVRQLATYMEGVAHFRLGQLEESASVFRAIARDPSHVRHRDTLAWLAGWPRRAPSSWSSPTSDST
jgi:hypothetical protein